ncbi:DUF1736 domain-containing protein [Myxococcota bacterium]|nr:DUF1736 domain-containing protein [Myxococcota bacterium]
MRDLLHGIGGGFRRPVRGAFLPWVLLPLAVLAAYGGSLSNGFVLDDHQAILDNPLVMEDGRALEAFSHPWQVDSDAYRVYRPLATISLAIQRALHGQDAAWFHAGNLLIHLGTCLAVLGLGRVLWPGRTLAPLIGALVFAVHPLHSDAVSSIANRSEMLATAGAILAFLAFRRWILGGRWPWIAAASLAWLAGLLSKESAGPLLIFSGLWSLPRDHRVRPLGPTSAGFLAAHLPALGAAIALRAHALGGTLDPGPLRYFAGVPWGETIGTWLSLMGRYLRLMVIPHPLSTDYSFESIPLVASPWDPGVLWGVLALGAILAATPWLIRQGDPDRRSAGWALAWTLVFLLPATHLVPLMIPMAERLAYGASAGLHLVAGLALAGAWEARRRAGPALAAIVLTILAVGTFLRDRDWQDDETLAAATIRVFPRNALMWANLGMARARRGDGPGAVAAIHRAVEIAPAKWEFRAALAGLLHDSGLHRDEADVLFNGLEFVPATSERVERICDAFREVRPEPSPGDCRTLVGRRRHPLAPSP